MSLLKFFSHVVDGAAQSFAQKQAMDGAGQGGKRKIKRGSECTPCAAMAQVDSARKQFGFSSK
jgi:hypothetical protein